MIDPHSAPQADPAPVDADAVSSRSGVYDMTPRLYVIPFFIVLVVVVGGLFLVWLLHEEHDPQSLVRDMRVIDRDSWQKAYVLSQLLRNPENDSLRDDADICRTLRSILSEQLDAGATDPARAQFCLFLCRALGEFRLADGLPVLLDAAESSSDGTSMDVRCAALEAIAVLAGNVGPEVVRTNPRSIPVLVAASQQPAANDLSPAMTHLNSTAVFALGVVGGPQAIACLAELCGDRRPNVRYNAATGLARHGDIRAIPVLLEMLDPLNREALSDEQTQSARQRKQTMVLNNAMRTSVRLVTANPSADTQPLRRRHHQVEHVRRVARADPH